MLLRFVVNPKRFRLTGSVGFWLRVSLLLCVSSGSGTVFLGVAPAFAGPPVSCSVKVYVADPDPNGLNVRMKPTHMSPVLGILPTKGVDAVMLRVDTAERGWLHFKSVEVAGAKQALRLPKAGWVSGQLVRVDIQSRMVGPTPRDSVLPSLKRSHRKPLQLEDGDRVVGVSMCAGTRVFVTIDRPQTQTATQTPPPASAQTSGVPAPVSTPQSPSTRASTSSKLKGWLEAGEYCGNPLTTCS